MAIRTIREIGDDILRKRSKEVAEITPRTRQLIGDMLDTMYEANGVGLAAPQVGILKRIVVIDVGDGPIILVNPEITEVSEETQTGQEGCLSVPGKAGIVTRPMRVTCKGFDHEMRPVLIKGEELLARAICHEVAHLDGELYVDRVEGDVFDVNYEE